MPFVVPDSLTTNFSSHRFGFFTNERGSSTGDYLVAGEPTRNVNIFAPDQLDEQAQVKEGYDTPKNVADNIFACLQEISSRQKSLAFFMAANYCKDGFTLVEINAENCQHLHQQGQANLASSSSTEIKNVQLHHELRSWLDHYGVSVLQADAVILNHVTAQELDSVLVGGAFADAHAIMIVDDSKQLAAYISASHHVLRADGVRKTVERLIELGADAKNLQLLIGPGLDRYSYEFPNDFVIPQLQEAAADDKDAVFRPAFVLHDDGQEETKRVLDIEAFLRFTLQERVQPDHFHNMRCNTLLVPLYQEDSAGKLIKQRVDFTQLLQEKPLWNSARRKTLHNATRHSAGESMARIAEKYNQARKASPGSFNDVARNMAAMEQRGRNGSPFSTRRAR